MKKLLHMTLVLALLLGLSACAKGGDNDAPPLYGTYHVAALVEAGYIDEGPEGYSIHDWYDYAGKLYDSREKNREKNKRYRDRQRQAKTP